MLRTPKAFRLLLAFRSSSGVVSSPTVRSQLQFRNTVKQKPTSAAQTQAVPDPASAAAPMQIVPAPAPRELLPPLLACLPTAFISPRPPPALLPLLSPILRQRVTLLSASSTGTEGWLPLLSWDPQRASKLSGKIEGLQLEPHPVSGELEIQDVSRIQYRRLDEETLQTRLELDEFDLLPVYVWCSSDEHAGGGAGWRLAELRAIEDKEDGTEWFDSASEATEATQRNLPKAALAAPVNERPASLRRAQTEAGDDDDYWASYDRTPGETPARTPAKRSPAPSTRSSYAPAPVRDRQPSTAEMDYYARYGSEVQPALDDHDPDEEHPGMADSTLRGNTLANAASQSQSPGTRDPTATSSLGLGAQDSSVHPPFAKPGFESHHDSAVATAMDQSMHSQLSAPRATSPSSQGSVPKLEQGAEDMTRAEVGVKQFVSTEMKSLFRLARSVGIERAEFERIVKTELDVLGMLEVDD